MAYSGNFSNGCSDCLKIVDVCMCACFCASAIFSDTSVSVHRLRVHSPCLCFLNRSNIFHIFAMPATGDGGSYSV